MCQKKLYSINPDKTKTIGKYRREGDKYGRQSKSATCNENPPIRKEKGDIGNM